MANSAISDRLTSTRPVQASLERNWETNVLIDDKKFSQQVMKELFMENEKRAKVMPESTLEPAFIIWANRQVSDKLDFIT